MTKNCVATFCCAILMTAPVYLMSDSYDTSNISQNWVDKTSEDSYVLSVGRAPVGASGNKNNPAKKTDLAPYIQKQQEISPYKFAVGAQYSRVRQFAHAMPTYKGNLGGIFAEFEFKKRNSFYADATALWNWGSLHVDGNPKTGVNEGIWEGDLGGSFSWGNCNRWTITAFTGFGYRRYVNDFDATLSTTAITIEYQNYFVPVGFKLNCDITADWRVSLNGKILPSVDEKLYVYTVTGTYWKQARKPSFAVDLPITWSTNVFDSSFLEVSATPFFRYWQLGASHILGFPTWKQAYWGVQATAGLTF